VHAYTIKVCPSLSLTEEELAAATEEFLQESRKSAQAKSESVECVMVSDDSE
jgi:hypothetical protein